MTNYDTMIYEVAWMEAGLIYIQAVIHCYLSYKYISISLYLTNV